MELSCFLKRNRKELIMPRRVAQSQQPDLVALGFEGEADQRFCLDALHVHSPESYRALPGDLSVIFERKDLEWLQSRLDKDEIRYDVEPVVSIAELSAEEAAKARSGRLKELLDSDFLKEEEIDKEIARRLDRMAERRRAGSKPG